MSADLTHTDKLAASCLILAGGHGRRLTPDKPFLQIEGQPIIARTVGVVRALFAEVMIVTNQPRKYEFLDLPMVADQRQGCGPLMGIYSGLARIQKEAAFVCAADMPYLDPELITSQFQELCGNDIVVPCPWGRPEFLHAFYSRRCLPAIEETLAAGVFRIQAMAQRCRTLRLDQDWFALRGLSMRMERAFANINTIEDYRRWLGAQPPEAAPEAGAVPSEPAEVEPAVFQGVRQMLIEQETAYQHNAAQEPVASLWAHSHRVGRIARHLALAQGWPAEPALLAGLLHDTGKFAGGSYHADDIPEEQKAVGFVEQILAGSRHEPWIPQVSQAILTMYQPAELTSDLGKAVHDADNLDKMGCLGIAQFFAKNALRRRFLDEDLLSRASIELTYAHHAPDTLKTATGRRLAQQRGLRTRQYYAELLQEWCQFGLGDFGIVEEDIAGITCIFVVPQSCACGGRLRLHSDIHEALKCRSVVVSYACPQCQHRSGYSFCLPNVQGLPSLPPAA